MDEVWNAEPRVLHLASCPMVSGQQQQEGSGGVIIARRGEIASRQLIHVLFGEAETPQDTESPFTRRPTGVGHSEVPESSPVNITQTTTSQSRSSSQQMSATSGQSNTASLQRHSGAEVSFQSARYVSEQHLPSSPADPQTSTRQGRGAEVPFQSAGYVSEQPPNSSPDDPQTSTRHGITYRDLGIFTERPKRPDMVIMSTRISTYTDDWPHAQTHPPEEMAEAGFYFVGVQDLVRCFYCKGGIKSWWSASDRPWEQHAMFYPRCPYIAQVKGPQYAAAVQEVTFRGVQHPNIENAVRQRLRELGEENDDSDDSQEDEQQRTADDDGVGDDDGRDVERIQAECDSLQEQNERIQAERLCKVCQVERAGSLLLPCCHLSACAFCSPALNTCPVCRQVVRGRARIAWK